MSVNPNWSGKTILVVEDEEINRFFFKSALQITNANVLFAANGAEGVKIALNTDNIDCVLMDIRLPEMDGYKATKDIKAVKPNLPIIVQTAYALTNERVRAFDSGCDAYISKPIKISVLFDVLRKFLAD